MMYLDVGRSKLNSADSMADFGAASDKNYHKYEHLLSEGWVPGRKIVCLTQEGSTGVG